MYNEMFGKMFDQSQVFVAPLVKFNRMAVANLEKVVQFQQAALQSYTNIGFSRLKAAAEISNLQDAQAFFSSQLETAGVVRQKMMDDFKTLADIAAGFKNELDHMAQENVSELTPKLAKKAAA